MKLKIDFWHKSTKETFDKFKKELKEKSTLTEKEINEWLEILYYAVSEEYGN